MTMIGKLFVFVNVALSFGFLALAIGIYGNRINWAPPPPDAEERVPGRIEQKKAEIDMLVKARDLAEVRWYSGRAELARTEPLRAVRQDWFAKTLQRMRSADKDAVDPIRELVYDTKKDPVEISDGKPVVLTLMGVESSAKSLAGYQAEYADLIAETQKVQKRIDEAIKEEQKLTERINGVEGVKGLLQLLSEQDAFVRDLRDEQTHLDPELANRWAEAQLLLKRRAFLEARYAELKKAFGTRAGR